MPGRNNLDKIKVTKRSKQTANRICTGVLRQPVFTKIFTGPRQKKKEREKKDNVASTF